MGYRYLDAYQVEPQFCFGHGLSYTSFAYESAELVEEDGKIYAECRIANTGGMDGKETVQVYLEPRERKEDEPVRQLKGFGKIFLKAGEKKKLRVAVEDYSKDMYAWAGSSLKDIRIRAERKEEKRDK